MPSKKKKPTPQYQPTPEEQRAIDLHKLIGETEDGVVPLYLELGVVLKGIKEERKFDWQGLLTHATQTLGLKRARIVRAWRIRKLHESHPEQVNGLTLYEGLQHEKRETKTVTPLELTAPLAGYEYQAAKHYEKATQRFEQAVGSKERAEKVMERFLKGETPVKATKTKVEKTWQPAWWKSSRTATVWKEHAATSTTSGIGCRRRLARFRPTRTPRRTPRLRSSSSGASCSTASPKWRRSTTRQRRGC